MECWNIGILECWFLKVYHPYKFYHEPNIALFQNPFFHYSNIPPFQLGLPAFAMAGGGEASNLLVKGEVRDVY